MVSVAEADFIQAAGLIFNEYEMSSYCICISDISKEKGDVSKAATPFHKISKCVLLFYGNGLINIFSG